MRVWTGLRKVPYARSGARLGGADSRPDLGAPLRRPRSMPWRRGNKYPHGVKYTSYHRGTAMVPVFLLANTTRSGDELGAGSLKTDPRRATRATGGCSRRTLVAP